MLIAATAMFWFKSCWEIFSNNPLILFLLADGRRIPWDKIEGFTCGEWAYILCFFGWVSWVTLLSFQPYPNPVKSSWLVHFFFLILVLTNLLPWQWLLQLTFLFLVLPCLLLGYLGQAAFLMKNQTKSDEVFFSSIPSKLLLSYVMFICTEQLKICNFDMGLGKVRGATMFVCNMHV